jgi:hypothetical protein
MSSAKKKKSKISARRKKEIGKTAELMELFYFLIAVAGLMGFMLERMILMILMMV